MTKRLDPRDRVVHPFTKADDKIFQSHYGVMPVKDLIPLMEYPHRIETMYSHAKLLKLSKRVPLWKEAEKRLLEKALELGMTYQLVVEASKQHRDIRNMTEASITQYLYRVRKGQAKTTGTDQ